MYPQMVDHEELKKGASTQLTQSVPEAIRADPKVRVELADGSPNQVILDTADRLHASLIVINLHGKSRTERALLGATAERVVRAAHRPVLSIPLIEAATK
jgi:nucleotide-binding universal stress UspA family protein